MKNKKVKDLMTPLEGYAVVSQDDTLLEAIKALDEAQKNLPAGRQKHRAVLVVDENKKIVGKIGHLIFLKSLEPKYNVLGDLKALNRVGVNPEYIDSIMNTYQLFQDNLSDLCERAARLKTKEIMHPVTECIDENAALSEAIHMLIMHQSLSILVTRKNNVVGVLRISDLFEEITNEMKRL